MDALLVLLIALLAFAAIIYLAGRSVKLIMLIGVAVIVIGVLRALGFLEG